MGKIIYFLSAQYVENQASISWTLKVFILLLTLDYARLVKVSVATDVRLAVKYVRLLNCCHIISYLLSNKYRNKTCDKKSACLDYLRFFVATFYMFAPAFKCLRLHKLHKLWLVYKLVFNNNKCYLIAYS